MKKLFSLLIGLSITLLLVACGGASTPEAAAKKYTEAVYAGDSETAISMIYLNENDKKEAGLPEMLSGKIKAEIAHRKEFANKNGGVKEISVGEPQYDNDKKFADVLVTVTFKKSEKPKEEHIRLIKTDDGWKLKI
ncbi:DUF4878 domain-containing protein [Snodgrassella alvi]|uniref:DUF4878 domain-containing protein n=1 Tax=Snodgrassella alvi TaxID=1196083 RepID=UPI000C1E02AF|nr:DUF4878 domain-containing protein [Snodgrassella alvi]PIT22027.1 hypothetical protein BGI34_00490 [Snodgrassella alvi]